MVAKANGLRGSGMRRCFESHEVTPIYIKKLLALIILLSLPVALAAEPVSLGHGKREQIINLERGAAGSAVVVPFMSSGFVAPAVPQAMELDPGAMVHQSQRIRDDSAAIFRETYRLLNQTIDLALQAEKAERGARSWANESLQSANLSIEYKQDAQSLYDKAQSSLRRLDLLSRRLVYSEMTARQQAAQPNDAYTEEALQQEIIDLEGRISLLEERINSLERGDRKGGVIPS
jgi:hypothetical protein